ncbi:fumarate reductase [Fomitiporia mediterranea MF3/22]|uniref:fumarate reductase n=1 Tax=Fomitiporia mediterranea (strain MF3/22) TaxID=694068 RepID=UPI0004409A24|nr:fumarate reductase [Fomitiporia mediterranea MF3/22]EJD07163.1 fumarate reductase [Fomitiporia mediterranea MF3/22]
MAQAIVVGGGLAGLSAAHTLLERGANVLLLDKQPFMGGNSTKATSGINGAGTASQQALGIQDSAKIFFDDTKKSAKDLARDDLIRVLTGRSGDAVNWLQEKFGLDLSKVSRLGGHSQPRTHRGGAQFPGMVITYAQMERLEDLAQSTPERVQIRKKAKVTRLLKDESGAVIGVEYEVDGKKEQAHGPVIIATGGYAADFTSDSLLKKYRPELWDLPTTNGEHCTGDGQKLAMAVGAAGIDLEKVQVHPTGLVDPNDPNAKVKFLAAEALRGVGGLLLDNTGKRFVDELQTRDYVTGKIWENGKYPIRLVLNGSASKEIEWHCKHYVGRGLMKRFESGADLAKEIGIPASALAKTFADYSAGAKTQKDPFGKKFFHHADWKMEDIFHVAIMTPVLHYTMGGLEIDAESRVLTNEDHAAIPGLFAAGEVAGGVHGANRLGGSSLLGCVVFGRVAGDSAAAYLLQKGAGAADKAKGRLGAVAGHLGAPLSTTITITPEQSKVNLTFSWADSGAQPSSVPTPSVPVPTTSSSAVSSTPSTEPVPASSSDPSAAQGKKEQEVKEKESTSGAFTVEEVAKHNKKDDCWVIVNGQVLDVTEFLPEHPGGEKAILLYAGRDATEEFNMLHDPKVIPRYAPKAVIGTLKQ